MEHIIILGAARAGKTTLAQMIHKKYNYSIVSIDSFVTALQEAFPNLEITHSNTENKFKLLPPFIFAYIKKIIKEYPNEKFILEGWHVYPKEIVKLFCDMNVRIICLGYTQITVEEAFYLLRKNEKENSYTKKMLDEEVKKLLSNHIEYSRILKEQCKENKIKFYDTSFDRENVLREAEKYLMERE